MARNKWAKVADATQDAKAIAFDGCHKIYLAMDDEQARRFAALGYGQDDDDSRLIMAEEVTPMQMLTILKQWYSDSCFLRFISAVRTNKENPNAGFSDLIPQGG